MLSRSSLLNSLHNSSSRPVSKRPYLYLLSAQCRGLLTLAIESSCDDTAVAILEKHDNQSIKTHQDSLSETLKKENAATPRVILHFNEKITSDNVVFRGIHPIASLESHQKHLAELVKRALKYLPEADEAADSAHGGRTLDVVVDGASRRKKMPDFVTVTRGPGMRSSLAVGLNTAKGLAVAWQVPLLGVHHMQAHALTPRFVSTLEDIDNQGIGKPEFPFLSLLVSGGHTLLLHSKGLTDHEILVETSDVAIGDALDKMARAILPTKIVEEDQSAMYGALLENYAFPTSRIGSSDEPYDYDSYIAEVKDPVNLLKRRPNSRPLLTKYGWAYTPPLMETRGGRKKSSMEYCFTGLVSATARFTESRYHFDPATDEIVKGDPRNPMSLEEFPEDERRTMAREVMRVSFEHLASRIVMAITALLEPSSPSSEDGDKHPCKTIVVAGGVASNKYLGHVLAKALQEKGLGDIEVLFPPPKYCTDNAAMIAWAGMEMFEEGWESGLGVDALRKWSMDSRGGDGGIIGVTGWVRRA
ncbi:actin-like ATPase domain-containing protein [Aulographum hederae CBS 113979]|uniref:Actin-like ATPase domain-containing protein n=1 Tax=Aulographum hederae CBS 113979 TaxID=1176131 RepID=A0A6G1HGH4_9PEZI|nr:actin-like ATPase domain-containing protein [Aulographum hederae CBS 113979]